MKRRDGHLIANVSLVGAACAAAGTVHSIATGNTAWLVPLLAGAAASSGLGVWLRSRLYLADPEACREYRADIMGKPFSVTLTSYKVAQLAQLFTDDVAALQMLFEKECASPLLSQVVALHSVVILGELVAHNVVSVDALGQRYHADRARCASFTLLWAALRGQLPGLTALGAVDVPDARAAFMAEYDWVSEAGALQPCAPPLDGAPGPGAPMGVYQGLLAYGEYARHTFSLPVDFFKTVTQTCPYAAVADFELLVRDGLVALHELGYVNAQWAADGFHRQVHRDALGLWACEERLCLKQLLAKGLVPAHSVAWLFDAAIPTQRGVHVGADSKESNIVAFMEFWESALHKHPELVPARFVASMSGAARNFESARMQCENAINNIKRQAKHAEQRIADTVDARRRAARDPAAAKLVKESPAEAQNRRGIATESHRDMEQCRAQLVAERRRIHDEFCAAASGANVQPLGVSFNAGCAQQ
jgi:hypothetical protein